MVQQDFVEICSVELKSIKLHSKCHQQFFDTAQVFIYFDGLLLFHKIRTKHNGIEVKTNKTVLFTIISKHVKGFYIFLFTKYSILDCLTSKLPIQHIIKTSTTNLQPLSFSLS